VHGVNGFWGIVALGLFADGTYGAGLNGVDGGVRGLFYGDAGQLAAECIGIGANLLYVGSVGAACFLLIERFVGNRVSIDDELRGLDVAELGMEGYPPEQGFSQQTPGIGETRVPLLPSVTTSPASSGRA
jgi:Amt family ammonium transporter